MIRQIEGRYGKAAEAKIPAHPRALETVCTWLLDAPTYHPFWSQYAIGVVRLTDNAPGFPPPRRQFDGTTHELFVVALDPNRPATVEQLEDPGYSMPYLVPVSVAVQFIATDQEMRELAFWAATGVVNGQLNPESVDAPSLVRDHWLASLTKTLAHIRGEAHAH